MKIRILNEDLHKPQHLRPQCDAQITDQFTGRPWKRATASTRRCKLLAVYELDEMKLCDRHCGDELIMRALSGKIK